MDFPSTEYFDKVDKDETYAKLVDPSPKSSKQIISGLEESFH